MERQRIRSGLKHSGDFLMALSQNIQCLSCEGINPDCSMLLCGHNICKTCVSEHSNMGHHRSLIRCEICFTETQVGDVRDSMPHKQIVSTYLHLETEVSSLKQCSGQATVSKQDALDKNMEKEGNEIKMFENDEDLP